LKSSVFTTAFIFTIEKFYGHPVQNVRYKIINKQNLHIVFFIDLAIRHHQPIKIVHENLN